MNMFWQFHSHDLYDLESPLRDFFLDLRCRDEYYLLPKLKFRLIALLIYSVGMDSAQGAYLICTQFHTMICKKLAACSSGADGHTLTLSSDS